MKTDNKIDDEIKEVKQNYTLTTEGGLGVGRTMPLLAASQIATVSKCLNTRFLDLSDPLNHAIQTNSRLF